MFFNEVLAQMWKILNGKRYDSVKWHFCTFIIKYSNKNSIKWNDKIARPTVRKTVAKYLKMKQSSVY